MFRNYLERIVGGYDLSELEMKETMMAIMDGKASESQIAGLLVGLRMKGETIDEITGAARALREKAVSIKSSNELSIDTCGTGGDGSNTFNISSTVAFVLAGAGLSVAKHGNRSVSSSSGSADLLEALGVNLNLTPEQAEKCLLDTNISFLFAPHYHKAMKHALKPRRELGIRTIFNLLGPLINPAFVKYQILGVYDPSLIYLVACVLKNLGLKSAMVVNGDGLDEFTLTGKNRVAYLHDDIIEELKIYPEDVGLKRIKLENIIGGSPEINKGIVLNVLKGEKGPCREIVLFNSAAAFIVTGLVNDWRIGIELAEEVIDSGKAYNKLLELIQYTNSLGGNSMNKKAFTGGQNILELIVSEKKKELKGMKRKSRFFKEILNKKDFVIIAEIKKASPAKGVLVKCFDPESQLYNYIRARVDAVSILTDEKFFQGSTALFRGLRKKTAIPLLRKDFIIDRFQIYESFFIGADIILLISSILSEEKLRELLDITHSLGMEALVEVYSKQDLEKAISAGVEMIGVNNRNLSDFTLDLGNTERILSILKEKGIRDDYKVISESGISSNRDIRFLRNIGVDGVLIGTSLMTAANPEEKIKELLLDRRQTYAD